MNDLTPKAERTRELILRTALDLFAKQGYSATTIRDIASEAGVSLGLAYRYFESKESLILALYQQMAAETDEAITTLPAGNVAERFVRTMTDRLQQAAPYREAFAALFSTILTPKSGADLLGAEASSMRERAESAFITLVTNASDAPRAAYVQDISRLLYGLHFAVILFWLRDSSEGQRGTAALLGFIQDLLPWLLRSLTLPFAAKQISRFVRIMDSVLGSKA